MEKMDNVNNVNVEDQNTPAEDAQNAERMYTKAEVDEIVNSVVRKRLAREKAKQPTGADADTQNAEIQARSSRLDCREYVLDNGLPKELLDIIDTNDFTVFKEKAEMMRGVIQENSRGSYPEVVDKGECINLPDADEGIKAAFLNTEKHKPKEFNPYQ